jgi:hypothetical protein
MYKLVGLATALVATVKDAEVWPGATWTDAGTVATGLVLDNITDVPPTGAGPVSVTTAAAV